MSVEEHADIIDDASVDDELLVSFLTRFEDGVIAFKILHLYWI